MKVAYIGTKDQLWESFTERMNQEGNDVYFLSTGKFSKGMPERIRHRYYRISLLGDNLGKVMSSISPDWVIYAGEYYMDSVYQEGEEADVTLLARTLQILTQLQKTKLILLSSTEVYGNQEERAEEGHELMPAGERGIRFAREEQMFQIYVRQFRLKGAVVRASMLYSNQAQEGGRDFLSRAFTDVLGGEEDCADDSLQPLHVADFVDGIKRIMDSGKSDVYNIAGSYTISRNHLYGSIKKEHGRENRKESGKESGKKNIKEHNRKHTEGEKGTFADNSLIKKELEWTDFRKLEDQLAAGEITFVRKKEKGRKRKASRLPVSLRRTVENALVFACFFAACYMSTSHSLFSQIDWLTIYVILISVFMGIRQSALAVLLASGAYLYLQNLSILEMTNFYSYAGSVLKIMEFVFLGLVVSYTTDMLREELRDARRELAMRNEEYEELRKINDENVMIKNEYEERLLDSKSGFPRLYRVVSRLMVLQPDRIFMEIVHIISEMIHTDTVAVYLVKESSPYLRLANALNEASVQGGKSWDISALPDIQACLDAGELYQGDVWDGGPSVVLPILYQGRCVAAILIKELPYASQTLYYKNLLKTLSLLLQESVGRALDYEDLVREELYVEGTDVLKPEAFRRNIELAREKEEKQLASYCVAQILCEGDWREGYRAVAEKLRTTDYLGIDEDGSLYVLLNNTGAEDVTYLQKRLRGSDITVAVTTAFDNSGEA